MRKIFLVNFIKRLEAKKESNVGGGKYDNDLLKIFADMNFELKYYPVIGSMKVKCETLIKLITNVLLSRNNIYFFRYPFIYWNKKTIRLSTVYQQLIFNAMKISKNKIAVFISDLDYIRNEGFKSTYKDIKFLRNFDYIIVHNDIMMKFLIKNGLDKKKLINQEVGNNLSADFIVPKRILSKTIVFAGNLLKSEFLNKFKDENIVSYNINLYGVGFDKNNENKILKYKGSYSSEDIVKNLKGSFGLIWDGDDIDKCSGLYGEYTRINNPSKFSQYIAAGLPVIAWKEAAVAKVIKEYNIGFVVNSLIEIDKVLDTMNEEKYQECINNVLELRKKIIIGYHFKKAIEKVIDLNERNNKII